MVLGEELVVWLGLLDRAGCHGEPVVSVGWPVGLQVEWLGTGPTRGVLARVTRAKVVLVRRWMVLRTLSTLRI